MEEGREMWYERHLAQLSPTYSGVAEAVAEGLLQWGNVADSLPVLPPL